VVQLEFRRFRHVLSRPAVRDAINARPDLFDNVRFLDDLAKLATEEAQLKLMADVASGAYAKARVTREVNAAARAFTKLSAEARREFLGRQVLLDALHEAGYRVYPPDSGTVLPLRVA
jgi:hypothetical protein